MKLHNLRSQVKALSGKRPAADPSEDARRIYDLIASMSGFLGCGEPTPGPDDEKPDDDDGEKPG